MGGFFKPSVPAAPAPLPPPPAPPPPPERSEAKTASLAEAQRRRFFGKQGGRAATLLTGSGGVPEGTGSAAVRLLGSVGGT